MKKLFALIFCLSILIKGYGQSVIYSEDFEGSTTTVTSYSSSSSSANWAINNNFSVSGSKSDSAIVSLGDTVFLETATINASTAAFVTLNFSQIAKIDFFDKAIVQVSNNNGASWTLLTNAEYNGSGFFNNNGFSSLSYSDWNAANATAIPTNAWWKSESFDLTAIAANVSQLKIRFGLIDADNNGPRNNYGWLVDDIEVVGAGCELVPPTITLTGQALQGQVYSLGPYQIQADIQDASGIASASLTYQVNSNAPVVVSMTNTTGNIYQGTIPAAVIGDTVCYSITATDATTCANSSSLPSLGCIQFIVNANPPPSCIGTPVFTYTYNETFSIFTPGNGSTAIGTLANNWENVGNGNGDTHDWFVYDRNTGSAGTGPQADHSPGDANYMYVEASGTFTNKTAILNTPCYDFTNLMAPKFRFWYHMWGPAMGSLHLDVFFGGQWILDIMPAISGDQGNQWLFQEVDLTAYAGNIIKLRFRANTGTAFTSDIAIDDIEIYEPLVNDLFLSGMISPQPAGCSGSSNEFVTVELTNLGSATQNVIPLAYRLNGGSIVRDTARFSIPTNTTANHTFQQTVNMSSPGNYSFDAWIELGTDSKSDNDSIYNFVATSSPITTQFGDTSNFDNFTTGNPGVLLDGWSNAQNDDHDWYVRTGGTPSNATGPSGDTTSGSGNYLYIEASNFNNREAILYSKCYDINSLNKPELTFFYHMNGIEMGELHIDIVINGFVIQDIISPIIGNQGTAWKQQIIDLTPFKGVVKIGFRGITGNGYRSDIALDDVSIRDAMPVGIEHLNDKKLRLSIYPNPSRGDLIIELDNSAELKVRNIHGQLITTQFLQANLLNKIDMNSAEAGVYFFEITYTSGERMSKKVILH